jgi:hypothetical protein
MMAHRPSRIPQEFVAVPVNAVYQLAALTIGARLVVADA